MLIAEGGRAKDRMEASDLAAKIGSASTGFAIAIRLDPRDVYSFFRC
jgi:hypothetical protein